MNVAPAGFATARPAVLRVLQQVQPVFWGWIISFRGSRDDLLAAGVAFAEMFQLPPCGKRRARDEHGDRYELQRRARGIFELTRSLSDEVTDGAAFGAAVAVRNEVKAALERLRLPRKRR